MFGAFSEHNVLAGGKPSSVVGRRSETAYRQRVLSNTPRCQLLVPANQKEENHWANQPPEFRGLSATELVRGRGGGQLEVLRLFLTQCEESPAPRRIPVQQSGEELNSETSRRSGAGSFVRQFLKLAALQHVSNDYQVRSALFRIPSNTTFFFPTCARIMVVT